MSNKDISDDELEDEIEKALKANEKKKDVFRILRNEKESLEIKEKQISASPNEIRETLNGMQYVAMEVNKEKIYVKTKNTELGSEILQTLQVKPPKNAVAALKIDL